MIKYSHCTKALTIALVILGGFSYHAKAIDVDGTAFAEIQDNIIIDETTPMDFGVIAQDGSAGTVILGTDDVILPANCGGGGYQCNATPNAATFTVTGNDNETVSILTSGMPVLSDGSNTMSLSNLTLSSASILLTGGTNTFKVGGTLSLELNQPAGLYDTAKAGGTPYTVSVNY
ncbi:MAG: DUF4402 domain-containing protein [Alphaproteobacteria bacterium]